MNVVTSPLLAEVAGVRHAFFTRHGGVSRGIYESLNVGLGSKDDPADVAENRTRCAAHFGAGPQSLLTCFQMHSAKALTAARPWGDERPQADAVVTGVAGLVCGALSADCAPVLLADPSARVVAAAHAGWGGALGGIVESAIAAMSRLGARPRHMVCAIGPCIGPASYEVGLEFLDRFVADDPENERFFRPGVAAAKRQFDLPAYVLERVRRAGVPHAEWVGHDTCADPRFFSNRRAMHRGEADYGRLLSAIMLDEP
jgi:YfiH family protein